MEENVERPLYDFFQHTIHTAARVGVRLSELHGDPFPNMNDEKMKKMEALNALYEEGVKQLIWGETRPKKPKVHRR